MGVGEFLPHRRFNTQPPEGGWPYDMYEYYASLEFQHTAARGRLAPALPQLFP